MSVSEKREKCRMLQAELAVALKQDPNPQEVVGALAAELEGLAAFYVAATETLPAVATLVDGTVQSVTPDDIIALVEPFARMVESLNIRTVPFVKESLASMRRILGGARAASKWREFEVPARLARDYLGTSSGNPSFQELCEWCLKRNDDVQALLDEAEKRFVAKKLLQKARQILDTPMVSLPTTDERQDVSREITRILERVSPMRLVLLPDVLAVADAAEDAQHLLLFYDECVQLSNAARGATSRLRSWMPVDCSDAFDAVEKLQDFVQSANLKSLASRKDDICTARALLTEACGAVSELSLEAVKNFPRLGLCPMEVVQSLIGDGEANQNSTLRQLLSSTLFREWRSVRYEGHMAVSVEGQSGEVLRLDPAVPCPPSLRADKFLCALSVAATRALLQQMVQGASHAHAVAVGAEEFSFDVLRSLCCQAAMSTLHVLWTTLVEGAAHRDTQQTDPLPPCDNGGGLASAETIVGNCTFDASPADRSLDKTAQSSLLLTSISSQSRVSSRPPSATVRASSVLRVNNPCALERLEPRPGSASLVVKKAQPFASDATRDKRPSLKKVGSAANVAEKRSAIPQVKLEGDPPLSDFFPTVDVEVPAAALLKCPVRDRRLSTSLPASRVGPVLRSVVAQLAREKYSAPRGQRWWYDRLSTFLFPLVRAWHDHLSSLGPGEAAWRREPRAYISSKGVVTVEFGQMTTQHSGEFNGGMHRSFTLTPWRHETWCKMSASSSLSSATALVGDADDMWHLAVNFANLSGRFVSALRCEVLPTVSAADLESFLRVSSQLDAVMIVHRADCLAAGVQSSLAQLLCDPRYFSSAGNLVVTAQDADTVLHPSLQRLLRFCFQSEESIGFVLECQLAAHGFEDTAALARRLSLMVSSVASICGTRLDVATMLQCIESAGASLHRDKVSVTEPLALYWALCAEVEPMVAAQHKPLVHHVGMQLFAAESTVTFHPQIAGAAADAAEMLGLECSNELLSRIIDLHRAVSAAPSSRSVVGLVGPSGSGKNTLLQVLVEVLRRTGEGRVPAVVELSGIREAAQLDAALLQLESSAVNHVSLLAVVRGVLPSTFQVRLERLMQECRTLAVVVVADNATSPAIRCWSRSTVVHVASSTQLNNMSTWLPFLRTVLQNTRKTIPNGTSKLSTSFWSSLELLAEEHFCDALHVASLPHSTSGVSPLPRMVQNALILLSTLSSELADQLPDSGVAHEQAAAVAERVFWLSCSWGFASHLRASPLWSAFVTGRLRGASQLPEAPDGETGSIFDFTVEASTSWNWCHWRNSRTWSKMAEAQSAGGRTARSVLVLTTAVVGTAAFATYFLKSCRRVALCGPAGTAKTLVAASLVGGTAAFVFPLSFEESHITEGDLKRHDCVALDHCDAKDAKFLSFVCNLRHADGASFILTCREGDGVSSWCPTIFTETRERDDSWMPPALQRELLPVFPLYHSNVSSVVAKATLDANALVGCRRVMSAAVEGWDRCSALSRAAHSALWMVLRLRCPDLTSQAAVDELLRSCKPADAAPDTNDEATPETTVGLSHLVLLSNPGSGSGGITVPELVSIQAAVEMLRDLARVPQTVTESVALRVAAFVQIFRGPFAGVLVQPPTEDETTFHGDLDDELSIVAKLLTVKLVHVSSLDALRSLTDRDNICVVHQSAFRSVNDVVVLESVLLAGQRCVVDARISAPNPAESILRDWLGHKLHRITSRNGLQDLRCIAEQSVSHAAVRESIADLFWAVAAQRTQALRVIASTPMFYDSIAVLDDARVKLERQFLDVVNRASDVIKFLRRIELAVAGKSIMSAAEQQFEVREETSNRALEGTVVFKTIPSKPVRLIAQFTVNFAEQRLQEVSAPSVFFGTAREDVVSIPAVNGGTCRARCDGKSVNITTGILDFQLKVESLEPLVLCGSVTDPVQSHAAVGTLRLEQIIEGENVFNKKWLRYGNDEPLFSAELLTKPLDVPTDEQLKLSRIEADRYISRVGGMVKTLQNQLEVMVLQKEYLEYSKVPSFITGRSMVPLLVQLPFEERSALVRQAQNAALRVEDPLSLRGLASLLHVSLYDMELWLNTQRRSGLAYGCYAEQNASILRYFVERVQTYQATVAEDAAARAGADGCVDTEGEDPSLPPPRAIVVMNDDPSFSEWVASFCCSVGFPCRRVSSEELDTELFSSVQIVDAVPLSCRAGVDLVCTLPSQGSRQSEYQMRLARPEVGSAQDDSTANTLRSAIAAQKTLDDSLASLLEFLHHEYEVGETKGSVVNAVIEIGKERVPQLMEAIRKTKDALASADSVVDRSGQRWKSLMDNAVAHAERVATLYTGTLRVLPRLSSSYIVSEGLGRSLVRDALAVSGKNVLELATKVFVTPIVAMLRLDHRLPFLGSLSALTARRSDGVSAIHRALERLRDADAREHVALERQLKQNAAAAYDEYRANQESTSRSAGGKGAGKGNSAAGGSNKKELRDFLSPLIRPPYPTLSYELWAQVVALAATVPAWENLCSNLQHSDVPLKGGILRQEKWAEWLQQPTFSSIPMYEKDSNVTPLDKLLLIHVMRPERTHAAALQMAVDVLGSEIPDPFTFEDFSATLAHSDTRAMIVFRPSFAVDFVEIIGSAAVLRQQLQKRFPLRAPVELVALGVGSDWRSLLERAVSLNRFVLVDDLDNASPQSCADFVATVSKLLARSPQYDATIVCALSVSSLSECSPAIEAERESLLTASPTAATVLLRETAWPRIACNESNSVRSRMARFYALHKVDAVPSTPTVSHRIIFLVNFLSACLIQRCRYESVAFIDPQRIHTIDADVNAAAVWLSKQLPTHSLRHWDEMRTLIGDIVGSGIRDPHDRSVVMAMIDWLVHPEVASQESLGFLHLPSQATLMSHLEAIGQLATADAAEHVGLHANEERRLLEREGKRLIVEISNVLSRPPTTVSAVISAATVLLPSVPLPWDARTLYAAQEAASGGTCLSKFIAAEVDTLQQILLAVRDDLLRCVAGDKTAVQRVSAVVERKTPAAWVALTHGHCATPHRAESLSVWTEHLANRSAQLQQWVAGLAAPAEACLPRVVSLGSFFNPVGFLAAFLLDGAAELQVDPSEYMVRLSLVPPVHTQQLPPLESSAPLASGIHAVGVVLEGASLTSRGYLVDPPDFVSEWWHDTTAHVPLVLAKIERRPAHTFADIPSASQQQSFSANRRLEAIAFSRANATFTQQRPSSAAGGRSGSAAFHPARLGSTVDPLLVAGSGSSSARDATLSDISAVVLPDHRAVSPSEGEALASSTDLRGLPQSSGFGDNVSSLSPNRGDETALHRPPPRFEVVVPLFRSPLRRQQDYVCDVHVSSPFESNYWMIRGAALICEPN